MKKEEINPNFEGLKQGISISRLINETINQTVICPVCKNIFWNPRMCSESKCGHTLCEPCLQKSLLTSEICLKCEYPAKYIINNFLEQQILSKFIFKCEHPKCKTQIPYNELPYHICAYELVKCKIEGCEWKGERSSLPQHITNCPVEVISCPNEECKEQLRRRELPDHLIKCSFQEVQVSSLIFALLNINNKTVNIYIYIIHFSSIIYYICNSNLLPRKMWLPST